MNSGLSHANAITKLTIVSEINNSIGWFKRGQSCTNASRQSYHGLKNIGAVVVESRPRCGFDFRPCYTEALKHVLLLLNAKDWWVT